MYLFDNLENKQLRKGAFVLSLNALALVFLFSASMVSASRGNLDRNFGNNGKVVSYVNGFEKAFDVVVQPDGKIITAGYASPFNGSADFLVCRYNADGSPDAGFGANGRVIVSLGDNGDTARAVVLQSDGKIVVGGYAGNNIGRSNFAVIRLNANGQLDTSFGSAGKTIFTTNSSGEGIYDLAVQNVGGEEKIVAVGYTSAGNAKLAAARLNANGQLDTSFGTNGIRITPMGTMNDFLYGVTIQQVDGENKIVAAGVSTSVINGGNTREDFVVIRYNQDGTLDASFNSGGTVRTSLSDHSRAHSVVIQKINNADKILIGGRTMRGYDYDFALVRYNSDGTLDANFGENGAAYTEFTDADDQIYKILLQSDNKIVGVGITQNGYSNTNRDFALARYNADGSPDSSFGSCGRITTNLNTPSDIAWSAAIQADGKIIAAGESQNGPTSNDETLVRYSTAGAASATSVDFDGDGRTDVAVFRPENGGWYINCSCRNFRSEVFGQSGDKPVPADYDGDGYTDIAVFRDGYWYINQSSAGFVGVSFGAAEDVPTVGDYDGDGKADLAVFRPSIAVWYIQQSNGEFIDAQFGDPTDKPVPADYDGDGRTDIAVFRSGVWYLLQSTAGFAVTTFGDAEDVAVPADYDGDNRADIAVFRPSNGGWYLNQSTAGFTGVQFGTAGDVPQPGDYDGDSKADIAVFRGGSWYILRSTDGGFAGQQFGFATDLPVSSR